MNVKRVPVQFIDQIMRFKLDEKFIAEGNLAFNMKTREKCGEHTYITRIDTGNKDIWGYNKYEIELKGNIAVESLRYRGKIELEPVIDEPEHYKMKILNLYKLNRRADRRVTYRSSIQIIAPIVSKGILVNFSPTGARVCCPQKLEGSQMVINFTLLKKPIQISTKIIEQIYDERLKLYVVGCQFQNVDSKVRKSLEQAVKEITLMTKKRLNE